VSFREREDQFRDIGGGAGGIVAGDDDAPAGRRQGLLVAPLAYWAAGTTRHVVSVPMAALVAMLVLVTGQTVLAHVLDADNVLSVIIEFLGGLTLIALIISSRRRS